MDILTAPHTMLSTICRDDFRVTYDQITKMFALMRRSQALGLAAPQVGIPARLFITHWGDIFINPKIAKRSEEIACSREGCLSLPGETFFVKRHRWIELLDGSVFGGDYAYVIQHELDHLNGTLISDPSREWVG